MKNKYAYSFALMCICIKFGIISVLKKCWCDFRSGRLAYSAVIQCSVKMPYNSVCKNQFDAFLTYSNVTYRQ